MLRNLKDKQCIQMRTSEDRILQGIAQVITKDMMAEAKLDDDAKKLLESTLAKMQASQIDERKAFNMIKKQLAKERKMVL